MSDDSTSPQDPKISPADAVVPPRDRDSASADAVVEPPQESVSSESPGTPSADAVVEPPRDPQSPEHPAAPEPAANTVVPPSPETPIPDGLITDAPDIPIPDAVIPPPPAEAMLPTTRSARRKPAILAEDAPSAVAEDWARPSVAPEVPSSGGYRGFTVAGFAFLLLLLVGAIAAAAYLASTVGFPFAAADAPTNLAAFAVVLPLP